MAAPSAWRFPDSAAQDLYNGTFDLDTNSFSMALFLSTSNIGPTSTTYAGLTNEHANANGYSPGGISLGQLALSGGPTVTVDEPTNPQWTASGGSITARWAVIYASGGRILCYCLLDTAPADVTATSGNTFTVNFHASGIFTAAYPQA